MKKVFPQYVQRLLTMLIFCVSSIAYGQTQQTEYQARILSHVQLVKEEEAVGFACWLILPDIVKTSPLRVLVLGGIVLHQQERWLEITSGATVNTNGIVEPVVHTTAFEKSLHWIELFTDLEYNFRLERFYANGVITAPIAGTGLKIGGEVDVFLSPNGRLSNIGPRLTIQLPFLNGTFKSLLLTTAYKFQSDNTRILRQYLVINF
jgi:hypothetical protein